VTRTAPLLGALLLISAGCHEVTEYTDSGEFGAVVMDATDLTVQGYVAGMEGAGTLVSMEGSRFLVGTATGWIHEVDSGELRIIRSKQVSAGGASALGGLTRAPVGGSVYALTGGQKLLEIDPDGLDVLDEFTAGPSPSDICRSPQAEARLYIVDQGDARLRELSVSDNQVNWEHDLPPSPLAAAVHSADPPILLIAHGDDGGLTALRLDWMGDAVMSVDGSFSDVVSAPEDTVLCAAEPRWGSDSGRLFLARVGWPSLFEFETASLGVEGNPACVCVNSNLTRPYFYAACADGDVTRVVMVNYRTWEIEGTAEVDGYPMDISSHDGGTRLVVLTAL
jgi:hypothetical protein